MEIGKRIAQFRTAKGYSVNKLAYLSGVSQSYLRDIELGNKNPTVELLSIVCDALDLSLKDFFDDELDSRITSDPVFSAVYQLSPKQRQLLCDFLNGMRTNE